MRNKIVAVLFLALFLNGCSFTPIKCNFWVPRIGWKGLQAYDFQQALSTTSVGTKCETYFE
jgi:PBP1b-binding outer membrane lipoprotein LpoB